MAADARFQQAVADAIAPYRELLDRFVRGAVSADDFEAAYLDAYSKDRTVPSPEVFDVVDAFFADVDSYVPEGTERVPGDLDAEGLKDRARNLLRIAGASV